MEIDQILERFRNISRLMQNDLQSLEKSIGKIPDTGTEVNNSKNLVSDIIDHWEEFSAWMVISSLEHHDIHTLYTPGYLETKGKIDKSVRRRKKEVGRKKINILTNEVENITIYSYIPCVEFIIILLLQNATKYSPSHNDIVISARKSGGFCEISISSVGPQLSSHEIKRLGEKGFRGTNAIASNLPGSGHGISNVKKIADAIGATTNYKSGNLITHIDGIPMSYFTATVTIPMDINDFLKNTQN